MTRRLHEDKSAPQNGPTHRIGTFHSPWIYTMLRCVLHAALGAAISLSASAQVVRNFPVNALRGELAVLQPPEVLINGKPTRLAPGARIRGADNMMMLSGALAGARVVVNFNLDINGQVQNVWVLTAEERSKLPWPSTPEQAAAWRFDPLAQSWSRP
jgi:hypothetical protein